MSVTGSASAAVEVEELQHLVGRLRRRAGYEQAVRYGLRGCAGALVVALLLVAGHRLFTIPLSAGLSATLVAIPLCFAAVASVLRWPTRADAARMADDLLGLEERLGTAVELLDGGYLRGTPLALLQLGDALAAGRDGVGRWPGFLVRIRRELVAVAILAPLVLGSLLLPHVIDGLGRSGRTPAARG